MIPFHVVQQGYTVRLNTGSFPFQKINLLDSLQQPPLLRTELLDAVCTRSKFCIGTFRVLTSLRSRSVAWHWDRKAEALLKPKK